MSATANSHTRKKKRDAELGEAAFRRLMQAIASGELKEGERVRESHLAQEWGIGVTPIREAVRRLAALGHVVLKPNHAPVVRKLKPEDIVQMHGVREALECFALDTKWPSISESEIANLNKLAGACEKARGKQRVEAMLRFDEELHGLWTLETNNLWLESSLERVMFFMPLLTKAISSNTDHVEGSYREHCEILRAIEQRNRGVALKLLARHIRKSGEILARLAKREINE